MIAPKTHFHICITIISLVASPSAFSCSHLPLLTTEQCIGIAKKITITISQLSRTNSDWNAPGRVLSERTWPLCLSNDSKCETPCLTSGWHEMTYQQNFIIIENRNGGLGYQTSIKCHTKMLSDSIRAWTAISHSFVVYDVWINKKMNLIFKHTYCMTQH